MTHFLLSSSPPVQHNKSHLVQRHVASVQDRIPGSVVWTTSQVAVQHKWVLDQSVEFPRNDNCRDGMSTGKLQIGEWRYKFVIEGGRASNEGDGLGHRFRPTAC